jgi:uncharacterized phage protein (TIGR02218 family)
VPAFVEGSLTTVAFCWRLERRDGVCLGFTTHDRDLQIEGLRYRAAPGLAPSAVSASDGFESDRLEVAGALTSQAIREDDLAAGRWDGAAATLFMVDWTDPEGRRVQLAAGELGDVSMTGQAFEAELRGLTALLDRPVVEQTSPECRARFGDKRCRADLAGRTRVTRVTAVPRDDCVLVADAAAGTDLYAYGRLRWITGANSGLTYPIRRSYDMEIVLREPPYRPILAGDLVEIQEGCDKSFATCTGRFANAVNFRGEPHLPGIDLLTRYPGA